MSRPLLEFGGGSGEILRDLLHLRSVSEAEALISGAEGRDQLRHISTSLQAPEPLGRFEDAGGDRDNSVSSVAFQTPFPWSGFHLSKLSEFHGPPLWSPVSSYQTVAP